MANKSVRELVLEYFEMHPREDLSHGPVVDWVEREKIKAGGTKPRDPWRVIRKLHQEGMLIKVNKGVYRYDPEHIRDIELFEFSQAVKEKIFRRDNYRCVVCGRGRMDGIEICADHIKPRDKGGINTVSNGQTLCTEHNLLKKNYSQTESGKRYFIRIYQNAVEIGDNRITKFCEEVFDVYDKHGINGHIQRPNGR